MILYCIPRVQLLQSDEASLNDNIYIAIILFLAQVRVTDELLSEALNTIPIVSFYNVISFAIAALFFLLFIFSILCIAFLCVFIVFLFLLSFAIIAGL